MRNSSLLLASALAFAGAAQAAVPARLQLAWELAKDGTPIAEIVQTLEHGQGRYEITEVWKGRGLYRLMGNVKRQSRGEVVPEGLRPVEYTDERTGRDPQRVRFDWSARTVTYQYKGGPTTVPLPANPRDSLQFLLQFAFRPPREEKFALDVVDGKGISDQVYRIEGRERVKTSAGDFDAVKIVRRKESGERAEIWLAADREHLPVRILVTDKNGSRLDQVLTRLSGF